MTQAVTQAATQAETQAETDRWRAWLDPCADPQATAALLVRHGDWHGHHPQMTHGDRFAVDCDRGVQAREEEGESEE